MNENICKNCNSEIGNEIIINGRLKSIELLSESEINRINKILNLENETYCSSCGYELLSKAKEAIDIEIQNLKDFISDNIDVIPIVTTHNPYNWEYDIIGITTGQSTIGTGALTEITSSFTDLFGLQSKAHNKKLKQGEEQCFLQIRLQTLNSGGNAIIAADIDYSEIGSLKGILMVCASGTSIRINNLKDLKMDNVKLLDRVIHSKYRLDELLIIKETI